MLQVEGPSSDVRQGLRKFSPTRVLAFQEHQSDDCCHKHVQELDYL